MKSRSKALVAGIAAFGVIASLAACSTGGSASGKTEIRVATFPPGADAAAYEAFATQEAQFEKLNPDIDVIGVEYEWTGPTFAVQLAGGSLPDVFTVPFTDAKTLLENGQLMDVTKEVTDLGYADKFNPIILGGVQDADGNIYGFPRQAYAMGLHYNRTLFEQAGLDPDSPPTTWDEVREDAKIIAEKTGKAGYAQMTMNNTGGWQLTAGSIAHGGRTQVDNGDGTYTSTIDNPGTLADLQFLHDLRWEDNSMGSNFLLGAADLAQQFAAGQVGMFVIQSLAYQPIVEVFGMQSADFGFTTLPTAGSGDPVTLAGGNVEIVNAKATEAEKVAAVEWVDYYKLEKYRSQDAAIEDAQLKADQNTAVAIPGLSPVSDEQFATYLGWIADINNVPTSNFQPYLDRAPKQTVLSEPVANAQELYAALDPVVQAVLTDENADIDALVAEAAKAVQAKLGR